MFVIARLLLQRGCGNGWALEDSSSRAVVLQEILNQSAQLMTRDRRALLLQPIQVLLLQTLQQRVHQDATLQQVLLRLIKTNASTTLQGRSARALSRVDQAGSMALALQGLELLQGGGIRNGHGSLDRCTKRFRPAEPCIETSISIG